MGREGREGGMREGGREGETGFPPGLLIRLNPTLFLRLAHLVSHSAYPRAPFP